MNEPDYQHVEPAEHDPACRRWLQGVGHVALDRMNCERCRGLWQRLDKAQIRRLAKREAATHDV